MPTSKTLLPPNFIDVCRAQKRLVDRIHQTPVTTNDTINQTVGCQAFFKCENLQKTGSFKVRGAINAIDQLTPDQLACGVITHSSGNHAAALAYAARLLNAKATIIMPSNASATKKAAVAYYGGKIVECEPTFLAREKTTAKLQADTGAVLIPPFDHPDIIAGQATCTLEFLHQQPELDAIICPIGGGGLISGCCLAVGGLTNQVKIIGAEPMGADDAFRSKQENRLIPQNNPLTIADGLRTSLGNLTWPFIRDHVDQITCVTEEEIVEAGRFFMQRTKLLIEPSSAVGVAVLLKLARSQFKELELGPAIRSNIKPLRVGVILCGGNMEL